MTATSGADVAMTAVWLVFIFAMFIAICFPYHPFSDDFQKIRDRVQRLEIEHRRISGIVHSRAPFASSADEVQKQC